MGTEFTPGKADLSGATGTPGMVGGGELIERGKKPTLEQVKSIITSEVNKWKDSVHTRMLEEQQWGAVGIPASVVADGYEGFTRPLMYIPRGAAAILVTDNPVFSAEPSRRGDTGEKQKEKLIAYAELCLKWMNKQNRCDVPKEIAKVGLGGLAVLEGPLFDKNAWGEEPERKQGESEEEFNDRVDEYEARKEAYFPFRFAVIQPAYCCPFDDGVGIVIEYDRLVSDIKDTFPDWDSEKLGRNDTAKWQMYDDGQWRCYLADDKPVLTGVTGDGIVPSIRVPYQWTFSTFGSNLKGASPAEKCVGIFTGLEATFKQQNNLLTAFLADIGNRVYHIWIGVKSKYKKIGKGPGVIWEVDDKPDQLQALQTTSSPPDFPVALGLLKNMIELNTFNEEMLGIGTSPTATQTGMRLSQARLPFSPFLHQIERVIEEAIIKSLYEFKDNPDIPSIPLGNGLTLQKEDVVRPVMITLDLQPVDPEMNDRKLEAGIKLWGKLSSQTIIEEFWEQDPDEELRKELEYAAMHTPQVMALITEQAIMEASMELELNKASEIVARAQQGMLPEIMPETMQPQQAQGQQGGPGLSPEANMPGTRPDYFARNKQQGRDVLQQKGGPAGTTAEQPPPELNRGAM